jgi:hypothetical protein
MIIDHFAAAHRTREAEKPFVEYQFEVCCKENSDDIGKLIPATTPTGNWEIKSVLSLPKSME